MTPLPPASSSHHAGSAGRSRPTSLRLALLLVLAQVAALAGFGITFLVDLARGVDLSVGAVLGMAAFALGTAALLLVCVRALWLHRRWARGPVITWQLLMVAVGLSQTALGPWMVVVAALGAVTTVLLLLPASIAATSLTADSAT